MGVTNPPDRENALGIHFPPGALGEEKSTSKSFTLCFRSWKNTTFDPLWNTPGWKDPQGFQLPRLRKSRDVFFQGFLCWFWCFLVLMEPGGKLCWGSSGAPEMVINDSGIWGTSMDQQLGNSIMEFYGPSIAVGNSQRTPVATWTDSAPRGPDPSLRNETLGYWEEQRADPGEGIISIYNNFLATQGNDIPGC